MEISWIAVIVAAVVKFVIGGVWYMPLFGKQWRQLQGIPESAAMTGLASAMLGGFIADLVMAYILARFVVHYGPASLAEGALIGFMAWIGFAATITSSQIFYEGRSWKLWAINNGYLLIGLVVMGAILGWWHPGVAAPAATV
jgi:hypothetical protein